MEADEDTAIDTPAWENLNNTVRFEFRPEVVNDEEGNVKDVLPNGSLYKLLWDDSNLHWTSDERVASFDSYGDVEAWLRGNEDEEFLMVA